MNAWQREIARVSAGWKDATPERRRQIEDEVYQLELDEREHYE